MHRAMVRWLSSRIGEWLAAYLDRPTSNYVAFSVVPLRSLCASLRPADVLLIEGDKRVSVAIKYLTQSTWSHAAFYIGDVLEPLGDGNEPKVLIEADLTQGVIAVPVSKYKGFNMRICRPVGLTDEDRRKVVSFMVDRLGLRYDLENIIDLMRYLLPTPPVPTPWRRRMLALGSGDPTRAICSTLIAQAFQSVRYPILPNVQRESVAADGFNRRLVREILHIRHHSLFTPRDFDVSPYFAIVKPTLENGFEYKKLNWYGDGEQDDNAELLRRD